MIQGPMGFEEIGEEEDFAAMLEESFKNEKSDRVVEGVIVDIKDDYASVDVGKKIEGRLPVSEIKNKDGSFKFAVGDKILVAISGAKNERPIISHKNAVKKEVQTAFAKSVMDFESRDIAVEGVITKKNKGGFVVEDDNEVEFFLPNSLALIKKDEKDTIGKRVSAVIVKVDENSGSIIISRKKLLNDKRKAKRDVIKRLIEDGEVVDGIVKKIASYGLFVEVDGIDGLVHYNEISYKGPVNPSTMYSIGDNVAVKAINYDKEKKHLSFSIKAAMSDPWEDIKNELEVGDAVKATVSNIENYGAFLDIGNDIEGFLHISEISWQKNIKHPSEVLTVGQELNAEIIELDLQNRKLRLSVKRLLQKPFDKFSSDFSVGQSVKGVVTSVTDFGAFIDLGGADGLLHISEMSWGRVENPKKVFTVGDKVKVLIKEINGEKIALSLKFPEANPWLTAAEDFAVGNVVKGKVARMTDFGAFVELAPGVDALLHVSQISREHVAKPSDVLSIGQEIEAKVVDFNGEDKKISLSMKALEAPAEEATEE